MPIKKVYYVTNAQNSVTGSVQQTSHPGTQKGTAEKSAQNEKLLKLRQELASMKINKYPPVLQETRDTNPTTTSHGSMTAGGRAEKLIPTAKMSRVVQIHQSLGSIKVPMIEPLLEELQCATHL